MKYNPKRHERLASLLGGRRRPASRTRTDADSQGMLAMLL